MREYQGEAIRNIAVVGHATSGKTTLVDALAYVAGNSKRHGTIAAGTTLTDTAPEEIAHGYSIALGCAFAEWRDTKVNLLDTPGAPDFIGDAMAGLTAADGALLCVSPINGVEAGTERMFREAIARQDPVLFVISMMDRERADFDATYQAIRAQLTPKVVPVEIPIGAGADFRGVINLFTKKAYAFTPGNTGPSTEIPIPEAERARVERYHAEMVEAIAATDDAILERFFSGEEIPGDEEMRAMKGAMQRAELFPLLCGSAHLAVGMRTLLDLVVQLMPNAVEMEEAHALKGREGTTPVEIHADPDAPFTALVFKTTAEPHVGDVSYFRTFSGTVRAGQEVYNATRDVAEKLNHLAIPQGRERLEIARLFPGDIGCVAKLHNTHTNDTLSTREHPVRLPMIHFPAPLVHYAIAATARADEERLQAGLHRLHDEDPTFETHYDAETHETIVSGQGERHLEIALARLHRQFGVSATLSRPRIAYRETLRGAGEGQGRHKKQTGGRGQFGDCWIRLGPARRGDGYTFLDEVKGGVIPRQYIPAVDAGVREAAVRGVLAGYPVVDFTCAVYEGSSHSVDSSEAAFRMAGILAFRTVAPSCAPALLEPIHALRVTTPGHYLGDVLGDLSARRAQILHTDPGVQSGTTEISALVPLNELHQYAPRLLALTHGRGTVTTTFHGYELAPPEVAAKVIAEGKGAAAS